ncbi:Mnn2p [Sugiyamaella lignohabitans]|uniref:Mnn2p n=1 Tax=Sugiyamaella lignohabitans TaxID=796027 RepID=A0A167C951_9ASCO|nr:Mnn2p [Sugiyamaella lignohabitans]ANB11379.1 Mnn2p [Sugiyamaella lignohabitans]
MFNRKAARFVYVAIFFVAIYFLAVGPWRETANSLRLSYSLGNKEQVVENPTSDGGNVITDHNIPAEQALTENPPTDKDSEHLAAERLAADKLAAEKLAAESTTKSAAKQVQTAVSGSGSDSANNNVASSPLTSTEDDKARYEHIHSLLPIFEKYRPKMEPLHKYKDDKEAPKKAFTDTIPVFTKEELADYLQVSKEDKDILTKSHRDTVEHLPSNYPKGLFKGQGVVFTSGGKYLPIMVTTLRMLRRVSPVIPVEVFLADKEEYEPEICEKLMPMLGARCVVLEDVYGKEFFKSFDIHSYQLKALSIWASSFEDVIFIDSDNVPIRNVEASLQQEPYLSTGYIVWPDYWFRTTSTHYYDIADIVLGERVRGDLSVTDPKLIPQADLKNALPDKSSESGQLMISKSKHYKSLLLTVYYNLNGFTAYYKLFTQGSGGEGDKETFLAAALALGEPVYQILTDTRPTGRFDPEGFEGAGMLQIDPYEDYKKHVLKTSPKDVHGRILFVHFNMFKLNIRLLFSDKEKEKFSSDDKRVRYCGKPSDNTEWFDYQDIEFYMWREVLWTACEMPKLGINFKDWKDVDMTEMCNKTTAHFKWLEKTHNS